MSAPQGSILINPLDTTQSFTTIGEGPSVELHSDPDEMFASGDGNDSTFRLRLQAPLFKTSRTSGYTSGTTTMDVTGFEWTYTTTLGPDGIEPWYDINGEWIIYSATDSDGGASNDPGTPHAVSDLAVGRVFLTLNDAAGGAGGGGGGTTSTEFDSLTFHCVQVDPSWDEFNDRANDGMVTADIEALTTTTGTILTVGPTACEAFAGRIFYAGIPDSEWSDTIFFSQIALKSKCFGTCHQEADPTSEYISSLTSADGGTIIIPNLGEVVQLKAVRNALLVFAQNGVWEISGGRSGFAADNYVVRQITDAGCNAPLSVTMLESSVFYTSPKGIIALSPDQYTGQLESQNMITSTIQTTWNAIPAAKQARVQTAYDDAKYRLYILYREDATVARYLDKALVYDIKNQGWYKLGFNNNSMSTIDNDTGMITVFAISEADSSATDQKMKFLVAVNDDGGSNHKVDVCDMNQSDYEDFQDHNSDVESPLPYLVTGWDSSVGSNRRRQAPIITVYNKRTTTGWTISTTGSDLITNGSFTGNATGWTLGSGWSYSTNKVSHNGSAKSDLQQDNISGLVGGAVYKITLTVSNASTSAAGPTVYISTKYTGSSDTFQGDGTHSAYVNLASSTGTLEIRGTSTGLTFKIDDVTLFATSTAVETNAGSTLMTPFWDWTDETEWGDTASSSVQQDWSATEGNTGVSGKIGKQVQTYKHIRSFAPTGTTQVDGYPIISTRHKVRGRGRTLSMRFDGATAKDSHLLGFTINYKVTRRV